MNKLILVLPAVIPLLSACNNSSHTTPPQSSPQLSACPSDSGEEGDYKPMDQMTLLTNVKSGSIHGSF
jgi:hypothetical protein